MTLTARKRILVVSMAMLGALVVRAAPPGAKQDFVPKARLALADNAVLELEAAPFQESRHDLAECTFVQRQQQQMCKVYDPSCVCDIDGIPAFGTGFKIPESELLVATLYLDGAPIDLEVSGMFNPWVDDPRAEDFKLTPVDGGFLLHASFNNGIDGYEAEWKVPRTGHAVRTLLARRGC